MNPDIEIIGEYKNDKSRFDCRCKTGDHSWSATAHDLKRHPSCKRCSLKAAWSTKRDAQIESVKKRIYEAQPNIVMIGQYVGYHNNVKCRCSDCGTEWDACPFNLVSGNTGCPKCRELVKIMKLRHDPAEMERTILKLRPDVVLLSQYTRMHDKMHCYCPVHQVEYYQTADKLLIGQRGCVQCANISTGESKMLDILKSLELRYNTQHVLKGCRYREPLRFDAFLPDYNIAIEYDGEGHYMPIDFAGKGDEWAQQALEVTQIRDAIKTEYCAEHNIELIRIPYWKLDNIQEFLTSELQQRINSAT